MPTKSHQTAVAVVPPEDVWGPIQAIRERHDRQVRRWMPHLNLLYPFRPAARFEEVLPRLAATCAEVAPFLVTLSEFRHFAHPSGKVTIWLAPEPREELVRLQEALQAVCPECDDLSRFAAGFTPHLSVGQANSVREARKLQDALQGACKPLHFEVSGVVVLRRGQDTPFEIVLSVRLAGIWSGNPHRCSSRLGERCRRSSEPWVSGDSIDKGLNAGP